MNVTKEKQILAALHLQQHPAPAKHLSTWCVPPATPAIKISNSKEAFRFIIQQEVTKGIAAIFLNRYNHLICHRYFLEDFEDAAIIYNTAKQYGAEAMYLIHFDEWCCIPKGEFAVLVKRIMRMTGITMQDVMVIAKDEHFSFRRHNRLY